MDTLAINEKRVYNIKASMLSFLYKLAMTVCFYGKRKRGVHLVASGDSFIFGNKDK